MEEFSRTIITLTSQCVKERNVNNILQFQYLFYQIHVLTYVLCQWSDQDSYTRSLPSTLRQRYAPAEVLQRHRFLLLPLGGEGSEIE
jgi:hypothetical protein